ncbi:TPA: rod shape-determining protein MreC [Candidatus Ventrenecus avicola]|nr:rod shape-determining protein MreC [Candidatus Ventrenecus avicola]
MKKYTWYLVLFLTFLLLIYVKDLVFVAILSQADFLETTVVLESDYNELKNDYDGLLSKNNLWDPTSTEFITSKVLVHDPLAFMDEITILKGSEQGLNVGDVIVNQDGYVGRITSTKENSSQVELLMNKNTQISVKVGSSYGILKSENNILQVVDITSKEAMTEGMIVYTSNYTDIPGDIVIGTVSEVASNALEQTLTVTPSVDFNSLDYVFVRHKVVYD